MPEEEKIHAESNEGEHQEAMKERLRALLRDMTEQIVQNPVLDAAESNRLTREEWRIFAEQRDLAAAHFEALLEAGIEKANAIHDEELQEALESNLRDEHGIDERGQPLPIGPHQKWRVDFYTALGIDTHALQIAKPTDGTRSYDTTLAQLIEKEDALTISGALLFLEYSIPEEFKRIQTGRDAAFPDQFVLQEKDPKAEKKKKGFARLYIDHHIAHDATSHYPSLEHACAKYLSDSGSFGNIERGMRMMVEAKQKFYRNLEQIIRQKRFHAALYA